MIYLALNNIRYILSIFLLINLALKNIRYTVFPFIAISNKNILLCVTFQFLYIFIKSTI